MGIGRLYAYAALIVAYRLVESIAFLKAHRGRRVFWLPRLDRTGILIFIAFLLSVLGSPVEHMWRHTQPGTISYGSGALLVFIGTFFRAKGILDLGEWFSPVVETRAGQPIVEKGLYKHIRHPCYVGVICLCLGCPVFLQATYSTVFAAGGIGAVLLRIRSEEQFLVEHLPGYREYAKRTWALVPGLY
jgi:protein-S-isoprenylcysteine O-methyltransferase Ste14